MTFSSFGITETFLLTASSYLRIRIELLSEDGVSTRPAMKIYKMNKYNFKITVAKYHSV